MNPYSPATPDPSQDKTLPKPHQPWYTEAELKAASQDGFQRGFALACALCSFVVALTFVVKIWRLM